MIVTMIFASIVYQQLPPIQLIVGISIVSVSLYLYYQEPVDIDKHSPKSIPAEA
jgi:hypothetical protein